MSSRHKPSPVQEWYSYKQYITNHDEKQGILTQVKSVCKYPVSSFKNDCTCSFEETVHDKWGLLKLEIRKYFMKHKNIMCYVV